MRAHSTIIAVLVAVILLAPTTWSQDALRSFENLHHFGASEATGSNGLIEASNGEFYGTAYGGGVDNFLCSSFGCGVVFRFSLTAGLTVLYQFTPQSIDGSNPRTTLVHDGAGGFYGTTGRFGANFSGTIFHLSGGLLTTEYQMKTGSETTPVALSRASNGDLLLATEGDSSSSYGAILRYATGGGPMTTLKNYTGAIPIQGILPVGVIEGDGGNLYGVVGQGGTTTNFGSVFKLTSLGAYTTLHSFLGPEGGISEAGVIQASDNFLYGATASGGKQYRCFPDGCGVIYRISTEGVFTVIHEFVGVDGASPYSPLMQASNGNFYGTTYSGGTFQTCPGVGIPRLGCGTIFRISGNGVLTTIHRFNGIDGANPRGALVEGADGFLYGTTDRGGQFQNGTIFRISK